MTGQDIGPRLIERPASVVLAEVDITDDYGVEVRQLRKRVSYSADEARALAHSILKSARDADEAFRDDRLAAASTPLQPLRFDLAPMCRDCSEGKHGACIGSTFVETAADVAPDEVECGCAKVSHKVYAGAEPSTFSIGDPDRTTPDGAIVCEANSPRGLLCTRAEGHGPQHAAGDGTVVVDVWDSREPWRSARVGERWLIDYRTGDVTRCGERAVKVESGHFDLVDGFGYVAPAQVSYGRRIEVDS